MKLNWKEVKKTSEAWQHISISLKGGGVTLADVSFAKKISRYSYRVGRAKAVCSKWPESTFTSTRFLKILPVETGVCGLGNRQPRLTQSCSRKRPFEREGSGPKGK
jgi:hypothetical protein